MVPQKIEGGRVRVIIERVDGGFDLNCSIVVFNKDGTFLMAGFDDLSPPDPLPTYEAARRRAIEIATGRGYSLDEIIWDDPTETSAF
jgi:hypothetical protein